MILRVFRMLQVQYFLQAITDYFAGSNNEKISAVQQANHM